MKGGTFLPSAVPFGYVIHDKKIVIDEERAGIVRAIFHRYLAGQSMDEIAAWLNREDIPVRLGIKSRKWIHSAVSYILSNERYISYDRLADKLNGQDVPYVPGKPWNKNMVARVLQDERYVGGSAYPRIVTQESFQRAKAAKPDVSGTADCAEIKDIRILARCGLCHASIQRERKDRWRCPHCMDSPVSIKDSHLIICVDRLLRRLHEHPDSVAPSSAVPADDEAIQRAQDDFAHELDKPEFDEIAATAKAIALAAVKLNALGSDDYETMRIQYILEQAKPQDGLDTSLLRQVIAAILIYPTGAVSLKLKNNQIIKE